MQHAYTIGFDEDTTNIIMKEEQIGKFKLQILFWLRDNEYWVYVTDEKADTDLPIECDGVRKALSIYDSMKRFIKREILKESE